MVFESGNFTDSIGIDGGDEGEYVLDDFAKNFKSESGDYYLFHYLVAERYNCLRENVGKKFIAGRRGTIWPVKPEELNKTYLAISRKRTEPTTVDKDAKEKGGEEEEEEEEEEIPLYLAAKRQMTNIDGIGNREKAPPNIIEMEEVELLDIGEEISKMPSERVTMDQSYHLLQVLEDQVRRASEKLNGTQLDKYTSKVIAQRVLKKISNVFEMSIELKKRVHTNKDVPLEYQAVLNAAKLVDTDTKAVERATARLVKVFPLMGKFLTNNINVTGNTNGNDADQEKTTVPAPKSPSGNLRDKQFNEAYRRFISLRNKLL